ncbi:DNA-directed RNA polymerases I and III subunit rpac1 [Capsicum galapagoense]
MGRASDSDSDNMDSGESITKVSVWDLPDVPQGKLLSHLELKRTRVFCASLAPTNTENVNYSGAYASMGVDNSVRFEQFRNNFKVQIMRLEEDELEFDMIGIDPSLANAFRRILIAELPTMAIEKVLIANNTSIIQDEVLAHRLGLIPIKVDPRLFEYMSENDVPNEKNTIVFKLHARCKKGSERLRVLSSELKWLPNGSELILATESPASHSSTKPKTYTSFSSSQDTLPEFSNNPIAPKDADIIIAKLGPGQEIELEAHAVKGIGKTHAKWSPVATAWYRMLPEVVLLRDIEDDEAETLVKKCPVKVFDIEDIGKGKKRATVVRPRACTLCRECIREEGWDKNVAVRRVNDHFIFTIESTGALPPEVLFTEAVKILEEKCERVITELS